MFLMTRDAQINFFFISIWVFRDIWIIRAPVQGVDHTIFVAVIGIWIQSWYSLKDVCNRSILETCKSTRSAA
jgi:hypothetical protein